jgi:hypothetical protein
MQMHVTGSQRWWPVQQPPAVTGVHFIRIQLPLESGKAEFLCQSRQYNTFATNLDLAPIQHQHVRSMLVVGPNFLIVFLPP